MLFPGNRADKQGGIFDAVAKYNSMQTNCKLKIPPCLSALFPTICNTRGGGNVFSCKQSLLQRSHQATKLQELQTKKGELLKLLHDSQKPAALTVFPGRLSKRHPHNSGIRRKGAPYL